MKRTITIVANNREEYLAQMLESLAQNDTSGWEIFVFQEPPGILDDQIRSMGAVNIVNSYRFGVYKNSWQAWAYAFEVAKSTFNLFLEEDMILSPDAVHLASWYANHLADDPAHMALSLFQHTKEPCDRQALSRFKGFCTFGMGITDRVWWSLYRRSFFHDARGWDFSIDYQVKSRPDLWVVAPDFSRAIHIGREGGAHFRADHHDKVFTGLIINDVRQESFYLSDVKHPIPYDL